MIEKIKAMGLETDGDKNPIVKGDNAKLLELKDMLDENGYTNDTEVCSILFGIPNPKPEEVTAIMLNHEGGVNGYCLLVA